MSDDVGIRILTANTYELIGRIAVKSTQLEFAILFMTTAIEDNSVDDFLKTLSNHRELMAKSMDSVKRLSDALKLPDLFHSAAFFAKVQKAFEDRNGIVHGMIGWHDTDKITAFHVRKDRYLQLDDDSLKVILSDLDKLEAEAWIMREIIMKKTSAETLIQLDMRLSPDQASRYRTTLA